MNKNTDQIVKKLVIAMTQHRLRTKMNEKTTYFKLLKKVVTVNNNNKKSNKLLNGSLTLIIMNY